MTPRKLQKIRDELEAFLGELTQGMGRSERRRWAAAYVRGLLLDGQRKSIEPMANRLQTIEREPGGLSGFLCQPCRVRYLPFNCGTRSSNITAKWLSASFQCRTGIVHRPEASRIAR